MAIDALTGTEISVIGPADADRSALEASEVRKLEFVPNKQKTRG